MIDEAYEKLIFGHLAYLFTEFFYDKYPFDEEISGKPLDLIALMKIMYLEINNDLYE